MTPENLSKIDEVVNDLLKQSQENSQAWDKIRYGKFTASAIYKLFPEPRTKRDKEAGLFSTMGENYILEKAIEQYTGVRLHDAYSRATEHGNEYEHEAIMTVWNEYYDSDSNPSDSLILKPNYIEYNRHSGGTPDAYININGSWYGLETKCPYNSVNHYWHCQVKDAESLKEIAPAYYWQCAFHVFMQKHKFMYKHEEWLKLPMSHESWIFASYDPRIPDKWKCHIAMITPPLEDLVMIAEKLERAISRKLQIVEFLQSLKPNKP